jgi:hypothetical protein
VTGFHSTVSSSSGLELRVDLNATTVDSGGAVAAQLTLFNSLDENLSLVPSYPVNSAIPGWNGYDFVCGRSPVSSMMGYALFQGNFAANNISLAGSPLQLVPPVPIRCPTYSNPDKVVFLADNYSAALYGPAWNGAIVKITIGASTESCSSGQCGLGTGLSGYWDTTARISGQNATTNSTYFRYFSPGQYTVAVQDIWDQTVYAHFQVIQGASPIEIVSVTGPIPPYNPGGPVVGITLRDIGDQPVTSLDATLRVESMLTAPYSFVFKVSSSSPLLPGHSIQTIQILIDGGFESTVRYPLTISGTLSNGAKFMYTQRVQIVASN